MEHVVNGVLLEGCLDLSEREIAAASMAAASLPR
jgi:hypothetical protein